MSLSCFDDKRYVLDDGVYTLRCSHKDSVTSCKKIEKDCNDWKKIVIIKKNCDYWKKIVIIKKTCNNWKRL